MPNVGATTFGAIVLAAQQRADMVNGAFCSSAEWNAMTNASLQQLYEKIVEAYGNDYSMASSFAITTDGTNERYALPTDFFKLLGVDLKASGSATSAEGWISIWRFNFASRNQNSLPGVRPAGSRTNVRYRLAGSNIWLSPMPAANVSLRLWYAPRFTPLVNSTDSFDGINGWEEWAINDVAMKARVKEETPLGDLVTLQRAQEDRLQSIIDNRDAGSPASVVDVYGANGPEWGGSWEG